MKSTIDIRFATDSDGFLSQECPSCRSRFKVHAAILNEKAGQLKSCPYCKSPCRENWLTPEQRKYIADVGANFGRQFIEDEIRRLGMNKPKGPLGISVRVEPHRRPLPPPTEPSQPSERVRFACCDIELKRDSGSRVHCPNCGEALPNADVEVRS